VRAKESNRLIAWVNLCNSYTSNFKESAMWMIDYWGSDEGPKHVRSFLLECPNHDVRHHFSKLLENCISSFYQHGGVKVILKFINFID